MKTCRNPNCMRATWRTSPYCYEHRSMVQLREPVKFVVQVCTESGLYTGIMGSGSSKRVAAMRAMENLVEHATLNGGRAYRFRLYKKSGFGPLELVKETHLEEKTNE